MGNPNNKPNPNNNKIAFFYIFVCFKFLVINETEQFMQIRIRKKSNTKRKRHLLFQVIVILIEKCDMRVNIRLASHPINTGECGLD